MKAAKTVRMIVDPVQPRMDVLPQKNPVAMAANAKNVFVNWTPSVAKYNGTTSASFNAKKNADKIVVESIPPVETIVAVLVKTV
jgi:hypothetical protein